MQEAPRFSSRAIQQRGFGGVTFNHLFGFFEGKQRGTATIVGPYVCLAPMKCKLRAGTQEGAPASQE